jgi:hypothetical protein
MTLLGIRILPSGTALLLSTAGVASVGPAAGRIAPALPAPQGRPFALRLRQRLSTRPVPRGETWLDTQPCCYDS